MAFPLVESVLNGYNGTVFAYGVFSQNLSKKNPLPNLYLSQKTDSASAQAKRDVASRSRWKAFLNPRSTVVSRRALLSTSSRRQRSGQTPSFSFWRRTWKSTTKTCGTYWPHQASMPTNWNSKNTLVREEKEGIQEGCRGCGLVWSDFFLSSFFYFFFSYNPPSLPHATDLLDCCFQRRVCMSKTCHDTRCALWPTSLR